MGTLTNPKHETFCQAIAVKLLLPKEAYLEAGYNPKNERSAIEGASKLSTRVDCSQRIAELLNENLLETKKTSITSLHSKAVVAAAELLNSSNEYIRASILKTILERSEPVVKQSQSIRITVDSKDKERRSKLLERTRVKAVLIPAHTTGGEGKGIAPSV